MYDSEVPIGKRGDQMKQANVIRENLSKYDLSTLGDYRLFNPARKYVQSKNKPYRIALMWQGDNQPYWFDKDQVELS